MINKDGYENLICGGVLGDHFFLLIFYNGKLVHWIQEHIESKTYDLNKRIHRLRLFIQADPFLSRLGDCPISILSEEKHYSFFEKAINDPLWRRFDLDPSVELKERAWKRLQRRFIYAFILLLIFFVSTFFLNQFLFSSKEMILAKQAKDELYQDAERQKILAFQNQILQLPFPLDLDLLLQEIGNAVAKGTRLKALKKIASEEGDYYLLNFSAIHFEEASRLENKLKNSTVFKVKNIRVGPVQSTTDGRVAFQMDLFL